MAIYREIINTEKSLSDEFVVADSSLQQRRCPRLKSVGQISRLGVRRSDYLAVLVAALERKDESRQG